MISLENAMQLTGTRSKREFARIFGISPSLVSKYQDNVSGSKLLTSHLMSIEFCHTKGILKEWRTFCEVKNCGKINGACKEMGCKSKELRGEV